jgi:glycosyltransferase involved in cell wall biosynthesis
VIYIVTNSRRSWWGIVERLEQDAGASLIELDPQGTSSVIPAITSKLHHVRRLLSPRLLRLRNLWGAEDNVLVIGWYLLPVLLLIHLRYLSRPRKLVSMSAFVQNPSVRRIVNRLWRWLKIPQLDFIVGSTGEKKSLLEGVGIAPDNVHVLIFGGSLAPEVDVAEDGPPYIFTGGYSNRDYDTFFGAVESLPYRVVTVASSLNRLPTAPSNVDLRVDLPWAEFERLIAGCHLLVLPLNAAGEISGGSVLLRGMRYRRPAVVTRHDGVVEHLGEDYSGFVPAEDVGALREAIARAMSDESFRNTLVEQVSRARERVPDAGEAAGSIRAVLEA